MKDERSKLDTRKDFNRFYLSGLNSESAVTSRGKKSRLHQRSIDAHAKTASVDRLTSGRPSPAYFALIRLQASTVF